MTKFRASQIRDVDLVSEHELGAGYKTTTIVNGVFPVSIESTDSTTNQITIASGNLNHWSASPEDVVALSGTSSSDGDYTILSVDSNTTLTVNESIPGDETSGAITIYHPVGAGKVAVDTTNYTSLSGPDLLTDLGILDGHLSSTTNPHLTSVSNLDDASISSPGDNEVLAYDSASTNWINQTASEAGLAETGHTHTSIDVSDFDEAAQDAVGGILIDTTTVDFTYDDAGNQITAAVLDNSSTQKVEISKGGVLVGARKRINFIEGANVTLTVSDDGPNDELDIEIEAASGGGASRNTAALQTTNDTTQTIDTVTVTDGKTTILDVWLTAHNDEWGSWRRSVVVTKDSGTLKVQHENADLDAHSANLSATSVSFLNSNNDLEIQVTGVAASTIDWAVAWEEVV